MFLTFFLSRNNYNLKLNSLCLITNLHTLISFSVSIYFLELSITITILLFLILFDKVIITGKTIYILYDMITLNRSNHCCSLCANTIISYSYIKLPSCAHIFHRACLEIYMKNNISCPMCREKIELISVC